METNAIKMEVKLIFDYILTEKTLFYADQSAEGVHSMYHTCSSLHLQTEI